MYTHTYTRTRTHAHTYTTLNTHTYTRTHTPGHICTYVRICAGVLCARAAYLLTIFSPFLVLGIALLIIALWCSRKRAQTRLKLKCHPQQHSATTVPQNDTREGAGEGGTAAAVSVSAEGAVTSTTDRRQHLSQSQQKEQRQLGVSRVEKRAHRAEQQRVAAHALKLQCASQQLSPEVLAGEGANTVSVGLAKKGAVCLSAAHALCLCVYVYVCVIVGVFVCVCVCVCVCAMRVNMCMMCRQLGASNGGVHRIHTQ